MLPKGGAAEAPKDQIMIQFVPGVPDERITEETVVHSKDVVHTRPHLPTQTNHTTHPTYAVPGALERKKLNQHILKACLH